MIRVLVLYPRVDGKKFNLEYYKNNHIPLVKKRLSPAKIEIDIAVANLSISSPYLAVTHLIFNSMEHLMTNYTAAADELNNDKMKFTDIDLIFQISQITEI